MPKTSRINVQREISGKHRDFHPMSCVHSSARAVLSPQGTPHLPAFAAAVTPRSGAQRDGAASSHSVHGSTTGLCPVGHDSLEHLCCGHEQHGTLRCCGVHTRVWVGGWCGSGLAHVCRSERWRMSAGWGWCLLNELRLTHTCVGQGLHMCVGQVLARVCAAQGCGTCVWVGAGVHTHTHTRVRVGAGPAAMWGEGCRAALPPVRTPHT